MVNINIKINNKIYYLLVLVLVVIIINGIVIAFTTDGSGDPTKMGHSIDELATCAEGEIIKIVSGSWVCGADEGGVGGSGTVTSISKGSGIALSTDPNPITTTGTIKLMSCNDNEILKYDTGTSSWQCQTDATGSGGGVVTEINDGFGINVNQDPIRAGEHSSGTISVDTSDIQERVTGSCTSGAIISIDSNGDVACGSSGGGVTSLSEGDGIDLSSNPIIDTGSISIDYTDFGSCGSGEAMYDINSDGSFDCRPVGGGVTGVYAGSGISVNQNTGAVTVTATGSGGLSSCTIRTSTGQYGNDGSNEINYVNCNSGEIAVGGGCHDTVTNYHFSSYADWPISSTSSWNSPSSGTTPRGWACSTPSSSTAEQTKAFVICCS